LQLPSIRFNRSAASCLPRLYPHLASPQEDGTGPELPKTTKGRPVMAASGRPRRRVRSEHIRRQT
jgi:hypothetical protein